MYCKSAFPGMFGCLKQKNFNTSLFRLCSVILVNRVSPVLKKKIEKKSVIIYLPIGPYANWALAYTWHFSPSSILAAADSKAAIKHRYAFFYTGNKIVSTTFNVFAFECMNIFIVKYISK